MRLIMALMMFAVAVLAERSLADSGTAEKGEKLVQAGLISNVDAIVPGKSFTLGVRLTMKPHWHTYWENPGESGEATRIGMRGPAGLTFGPAQWPIPTRFDNDHTVTYGYENEVLLLVPVRVTQNFVSAGPVTLTADVSWLSCNETCVEGGATLAIELPVRVEAKVANADLFATWRTRLPVSRQDPRVAAAVEKIDQPMEAGGKPAASFTIAWKVEPKRVEWFPLSTRAVAIESVLAKTGNRVTRVEFKTTVYKPAEVPDGRVEGVLVYEDAHGERLGFLLPMGVHLIKVKADQK